MKTPVITVLMTVYNGERFLSEAISSILCQTYENFEFVIIDDASTDKSEELIRSYKDTRIRYYKNKKNIGQTASLNFGLNLSEGKYIARIDQDDLSNPERLEIQFNYMKENQNISVVGSWAESIDNNAKYKYTIIHPINFAEIRESIACGCPLSHSSAFFRREDVIKSGGYPENIIYAMDWNLWIKLINNRYKLVNLPLELVSIRTHDSSSTSSKELQLTRLNEEIILLKKAQNIPLKASTKRIAEGIRFHSTLEYFICLFKAKKMRKARLTIIELYTINPVYWLQLVLKKLVYSLTKNSKAYYTKITPIQRYNFRDEH